MRCANAVSLELLSKTQQVDGIPLSSPGNATQNALLQDRPTRLRAIGNDRTKGSPVGPLVLFEARSNPGRGTIDCRPNEEEWSTAWVESTVQDSDVSVPIGDQAEMPIGVISPT